MPDSIVVRCFSCRTHQVVQENKKRQFQCRLCGAKQSVKAVLATGSAGRELRELVQKLNFEHGKQEEEQRLQTVAAAKAVPALAAEQPSAGGAAQQGSCASSFSELPGVSSRWARFCDPSRPESPVVRAIPEEEQACFTTNFGVGRVLGCRPKGNGKGKEKRFADAKEQRDEPSAGAWKRRRFFGNEENQPPSSCLAGALPQRAAEPSARLARPQPPALPAALPQQACEPRDAGSRWARFVST
eukprot:TRINITY_DN87167_c0_g1_i1.p1 TRINITY_DN87167_c0_g1~~TRINITY_DN87167_c0_g1_i1.p1  ORF type:complete len:243 (+),score=52.57 TRINITY_DN87167_c0_g1_i1:129-857(+)